MEIAGSRQSPCVRLSGGHGSLGAVHYTAGWRVPGGLEGVSMRAQRSTFGSLRGGQERWQTPQRRKGESAAGGLRRDFPLCPGGRTERGPLIEGCTVSPNWGRIKAENACGEYRG